MADKGANNSLESRIAAIAQAVNPRISSTRVLDMAALKQTGSSGAGHGYVVVIALVLLALVSAPSRLAASELKDQTRLAWDNYVQAACSRAEARSGESFLRISDFPARRHDVQAGEIVVWREATGHQTVAHGLIHHWMGAVFVPKAAMADVLSVIRDYDRYPEIYKPAVMEAKGVGAAGNDDRFSMLLVQKVLFVKAAMQGEYETRYVQIDPKRWYSISQSTRLQAIEKFGEPEMRVLPVDQGPGYLWRLYSFTRFEESDGGVYIEIEALGLSRDVPMMLRWLVDPVVEHVPRNSLYGTLEETREAVLAKVSRED